MGTVRFNRQRGKWQVDYTAASGERVRQLIGPGEEGRRLAKQVLKQREAEAQLGLLGLPTHTRLTFGDFASDWLHRTQARIKPRTFDLYADIVRVHLTPRFGSTRLSGITRRDIEAFVTDKRAGTRRGRRGSRVPLAASTINAILVVLKMILADAVDQDLLGDNPASRVKPLRRGDEVEHMHMLSPVEVTRLIEVAEEPWRTLYLLLVHSGLRIGEATALRWRDLDLRAGVLHVRRTLGRVREADGRSTWAEGSPKSRAGRRQVELSPTAIQALLAHPAGDDPERDFVFRSRTGGPLDANNIRAAFRRHLTAAGLPERRLHDLRHTFAGLLIAAGVHVRKIQQLMGHSSIGVTMGVYGHLLPAEFADVGVRLDGVLQNGNNSATAPVAPGAESRNPAS